MTIKVPGMMCMHCVKSVTDALTSLDGVSDVQVDINTKLVNLQADESLRSVVVETVEDLGFDVE